MHMHTSAHRKLRNRATGTSCADAAGAGAGAGPLAPGVSCSAAEGSSGGTCARRRAGRGAAAAAQRTAHPLHIKKHAKVKVKVESDTDTVEERDAAQGDRGTFEGDERALRHDEIRGVVPQRRQAHRHNLLALRSDFRRASKGSQRGPLAPPAAATDRDRDRDVLRRASGQDFPQQVRLAAPGHLGFRAGGGAGGGGCAAGQLTVCFAIAPPHALLDAVSELDLEQPDLQGMPGLEIQRQEVDVVVLAEEAGEGLPEKQGIRMVG